MQDSEVHNPRYPWMPDERIKRHINLRLAIDRYCIAVGDAMYQEDVKAHIRKCTDENNKTYEYLDPQKALAFDEPIIEYLKYLYHKYYRNFEQNINFPKDQPLNLQLIPPSMEQFRWMLKNEGVTK